MVRVNFDEPFTIDVSSMAASVGIGVNRSKVEYEIALLLNRPADFRNGDFSVVNAAEVRLGFIDDAFAHRGGKGGEL